MPNSTTGIMPAPTPVPHHEVPPQPTITLHLDDIRQVDGLYCLTDLWKLSGGKDKDKPTYFFRTDKAKELVSELEKERQALHKCEPYIIRVLGKGKEQGTYVCRELVYAYANWISPSFYLVVIRTFDEVATKATTPLTLADKFNQKTADLKAVIDYLHECGSGLSTHGKKTKPRLLREIKEMLNQIQPQLPFAGE